ncbi:hypothetical protein D3C87_1763860 [compost metagenome]
MIPLLATALAVTLVASPSAVPSKPDWTPIAASAVLPGSGQYLQGQQAKAIGHLGAVLACLGAFTYAQVQSADTTGAAGAAPNIRNLASAALLGLAIWSPLDAWLFQHRLEVQQSPVSPSSSGGN